MRSYELAEEFYAKYAKRTDLYQDILLYAATGAVYADGECLILAKYYADCDCWHIHFAIGVGCMARFFELAPFTARWVTFARPDKGRDTNRYSWERLKAYADKTKKTQVDYGGWIRRFSAAATGAPSPTRPS